MSIRELKDSTEGLAVMVMQAQMQLQGQITKPEMSILQLIGSAFAISSVAGLARLLHSHKVLTLRAVTSAILYSGICGIIIALLWTNYGNDNPYLVLGICGLAGIGGVSIVDLAAAAFKAGGMNVEIKSSKDDIDKPEDL